MIEITNVEIIIKTESFRCKGIASITINNCFVVNDIKIIEGKSGLFIAMPSRKTVNGEIKDIAHPINSETREIIQKAILEKYNNL